MAYSISHLGDSHVLELKDSFSVSDISIVRVFSEILDRFNGRSCVLALDKLDHLDCYGVEMLILMSDLAQAKGVRLCLRGPRFKVRERLGLCGVDRIIAVQL